MSASLQRLALGALLLPLLASNTADAKVPMRFSSKTANESWIDPETPLDKYTMQVPTHSNVTIGSNASHYTYKLIFSDEFNDTTRKFGTGFDRKWTAIDVRDESNMGQHYFLPQAVQIDKDNLIITTSKPKIKYRGAEYVSGSLQTWNKFCYTGGFVEVRAILPGKWGVPGTWPAIWIMGNLGRAAFLNSQEGMWPWSFDACAPVVEKAQTVHQKINACGNLTDKHDKSSYPEHYGLDPFKGRGATEIDVIEAQIRRRDEPAYISTSLQIRPSLWPNMRPDSEILPQPWQWYQGLAFGERTRINSDYYGENGLDSLSALTQLESNSFLSYHLYQLDWSPGPEGYIRWWMDNQFLFEVPGSALNVWSQGVPPRQIPVEPSYLILSTAVSEKFSPPCDGQICDSLWPSNFTIDYVRLYQGNPNRYTSIGCNPPGFATSRWIMAHPVDYGLPWYTSIEIDAALVWFFAALNAGVSALITFRGYKHAGLTTAYVATLWLVASFYGVFSLHTLDELAWIHATIAVLCGVVFGGILSLVSAPALGAMLGTYVGVVAGQYLPLLVARLVTAACVAAGIGLSLAPRAVKHVVVLATASIGSLALVMSLTSWWSQDDNVAVTLWRMAGYILGGDGYNSTHVCAAHCSSIYSILVTLTVAGAAAQYYTTRSVPFASSKAAKLRSWPAPISASADARAWKPSDTAGATASHSASTDRINFFSPTALPRNMQQYAAIFRIAMNVQRAFGFQLDNFRNQTEHIVMLLTNAARRGANPYRTVHDLVFSNYSKWCRKLEIVPKHWNEKRGSQNASGGGGMNTVDEISVDLCLFFFIWGEASNARHSPEYLCFLFHKMKDEFPSVRNSERETGHFLDTVITPVYGLVRAQMASNDDHDDRLNYDDFNEFFWTPACLQFDYKHEDVVETNSPNPMAYFKHKRDAALGASGSASVNGRNKSKATASKRPKSIAEGFAESQKTFLEKRTWLAPLRAFSRVFDFHVVAFHLLATFAFAREQEMSTADGAQIIASTAITPFLLSIVRDALDIFAVYNERATTSTVVVRHVARLILHLALSVVSLTLYWYAWTLGDAWWLTFYVTLGVLHVPGLFNCVLQVTPQLNNWLRRTRWKPVAIVRDILNPMNRLYVGDNVLDTAAASIGYQVFWSTMLSWKLLFSYKFEIYPLVVPTLLLYADHMENNVSIVSTALLILLNWVPFFLVFCVDITIWNAIWVAVTGTFVGFSSHIGEIRNFGRVRAAFSRAADVFNTKIIAASSKTGQQFADAHATTYGASTSSSAASVIGHEVLDRFAGDAASTVTTASASRSTNANANDATPLLSFSRRKQTPAEVKTQRRQKWFSFSCAWDAIIEAMRADDLISNKEQSLLLFQRLDGYQREIYLPQFQLAGCFETFTSTINDLFSPSGNDAAVRNVSERVVQDKLLEVLSENPMVEEAIEEIWELANWVLINILGPCHTNDVRYISSTLNSWAARGVFRALNLKNVASTGRALAELLALLKSNVSGWKSSAKVVPVRKSPSDYSSFEFPQPQAGGYRPMGTSGMAKSASTTGLNQLGGTVPRRSRGSGVAKIAAMQQTAKPAKGNAATHAIPSAHIMQIRDRMRHFLNLAKSLIRQLDERDPIFAEAKGISDRLTWMLTQERGFMWDDNYTGEQVTLTAFEKHADVIVKHLHGLLTLQKIDAAPTSYDAQRRLLFFVNSLFMDMPLAPLIEEMKSWSVMTPFYGEDVLYSKSDLESKQDGLDVHTLLFLQTLYKKDWENFLERVKPKKNLWKDPSSAIELRLWASLRGQTLTRTVQGMMYGEAAIRLLAELEQVPVERIEELIKTKFTYVVACQIYGRQKRNNDPKAKDIEFLLHRFPNLRVAYIDEVRVNYQREQSYFAVLVKSGETLGAVDEIYRIRLPGNPILGEGKPENQNAAIVFTRGENLQTIDMNQDGYIEESLKMRNLLEEFDSGTADRPTTIVGLPEHIFTGSVSSLANYMALQETSFVTLGQRTLARPLRVRLHYGHPDVFNKLFFITRGGISKASKGINLSEDIFAGYNNCLRGGSVTFPEYVKCGKGRDVGMQQIYKFEAKLAQGAAEQSLSRDVYRISQRLDFFKLLSFYYNHVGFYLSMSLIIWTVYILLYCNLLRALLSLEGVGGRTPVLLSQLQVMLGSVAFFTTAPLLATISVERGFKAAIKEVFMIFVTGGPLYFLFHIGTKWFYYGQTILAGGAKYRATGRGFVTKHSRFDELYRFYASSHLYAGVEIAAGLSIYYVFTIGQQYFAMTWSLWLVVASWYLSPFWFNPLAFEWSDVVEDFRDWFKWMRGDGGNANQSWEAWFKEENAYFVTLRPWAKVCVTLKGLLFFVIALAIVSAYEPYHSLLTESTWLPFSICLGIAGMYVSVTALFLSSTSRNGESGLVRFLKLILVLVTIACLVIAFVYIDGMWQCVLSMGYLVAALGCWSLLFLGSNSRFVQSIYFVHDACLGIVSLSLILFFAALYVPGKIQTWLLYNNALSRGVVIEDILRSNARNDDREDDLSALQMRAIILEQQRVIAALAGADSDDRSSSDRRKDEQLPHTLSDNTLNTLRNVSETDFLALQEASSRLQAIFQPQQQQHPQMTPQELAQTTSLQRSRRAHSTNDFSNAASLPPFGAGLSSSGDDRSRK